MKKDGFLDDVLLRKNILGHITSRTYRFSKHASEEQARDDIDVQDTLYVLATGIHERNKTIFDNVFQTWKYAIKGKTEDLKNVRVIIAFSSEMMIITVMEL
jgi:hypothetical protein